MINLLSKRNSAKFTVLPVVDFGWRFALTDCCPVQCMGEFDRSSIVTLTAFRRADLAAFAHGLDQSHTHFEQGRAEVLWSVDGCAVLSVRWEAQGQVRGDFMVCSSEPGPTIKLKARLELDQTYLPELAEQCRRLLAFDYTGD